MQHLAMIMDGNRRWARENKLAAISHGHKKGLDVAKVAVRFCLKNKIKYLSLFIFSLENLKRSAVEKGYLFGLMERFFQDNIDELISQGICIRFIGDRALFPKRVASMISDVETRTKGLDKLFLNLLFCYGSQQEMVFATKKVAEKVKNGLLQIDAIDEATLRNEMWLGGSPDPDLILRTGKVSRLSNFLLFQAAYSELMFLDCYWPEINEQRLSECVDTFYATRRNFGE